MTKVYRVTYDRLSGVWLVTHDGYPAALARYPTKYGATVLATRIADTYQPSRLVIHHIDGRVEQEQKFRGELAIA